MESIFHKGIRLIGMFLFLCLAIASPARGSLLDWLTPLHEHAKEHFEITGSVVCTTCQPEEVQGLHPDATALYPVRHPQGQFLFKVSDVTGLSLRRAIAWPRSVELRLADSLFHQLAAEKNRFKQMKLNARLKNGNIVEILDVHIP